MRIETAAGLKPADLAAVESLRDECEAIDHLDLKLELRRAQESASVNTALAFDAENVIGYCGIDDGSDAEVCGVVQPAHRGRGVGTALLESVLPMAAEAGKDAVLVICEDAAPVALAWLERRGATLHHSEHRMLLDVGIDASISPTLPRLRPAAPGDQHELARLLADGFGENATSIADRLACGPRTPGTDTLLAHDGELLVGTTRLVTSGTRTMIYGFVVDAALRGQGHGRSMMRATLRLLRERGAREVGLEVDTENVAAQRLYAGHGFRVVTTYRYMRLGSRP